MDPDTDFEDVIKGQAKGDATVGATEADIFAQEDADFLQELHEVQASQPQLSAAIAALTTGPPATPDARSEKSAAPMTPGVSTPGGASVSTPVTLTGRGAGTASQPSSAGVTPVRPPPVSASATSSPAVGTTDHGALSSFFNSLITSSKGKGKGKQ